MPKTLTGVFIEEVEKHFSLLPWLRQSFFGLSLFCVLFLLLDFSDSDTKIPVVPVTAITGITDTVLKTDNEVVPGMLQLNKTHWVEYLLLPGKTSQLDAVTLSVLLLLGILLFLLIRKIQGGLFEKDLTTWIRLPGFLLFLHSIYYIVRYTTWLPQMVETRTHYQFTTFRTFPIVFMLEVYFAFLIIVSASWYRKAMQLQDEQNHTV